MATVITSLIDANFPPITTVFVILTIFRNLRWPRGHLALNVALVDNGDVMKTAVIGLTYRM